MKIDPEKFRVREDKKIDLKKWQTRIDPFYKSKDEYKSLLAQHTDELAELQELLYAHNRYSLLLIFQAMDAAGKDGAIKHVMSGINPQGCQVYSFKHPSAEELDHDFLWRTTRALPERGRIGIFNRSYYEEVLIVRVHPEILKAQNIPEEHRDHESIWDWRFRSIREHERHLHHNGTRIIKFFLHLSREEQKNRLLARIDKQEKNWKFDSGDLRERKLWPKYMAAYQDCFRHTSTNDCPWYIIPADDKKNARLIISRTIIDTLRRLKMSYPKPTPAQLADLQARRKELLDESN
ncbi:MAG TPA: ADP-polyphosphate phosphotransferase [Verrucomicrobiae bacterium]